MISLKAHVLSRYASTISDDDTGRVQRQLDQIARTDGLNTAVTLAWQHGLASGYIPLTLADEPPASEIRPTAECPYRFVHVPVRRIRGDTAALVERRIMNGDHDPARLVYHEDGIIDTGIFTDPAFAPLTAENLDCVLDSLAHRGLLMPVDRDDPRVRFVEPSSARLYGARYLRRWFVRDLRQSVTAAVKAVLGSSSPVNGLFAATLERRSPCFYCSAATLFPLEVTVSARTARGPQLARGYRLGFTFAPVGDPGQVRHFLAWDDPAPGEPILNMDLRPHSFSDLVQLVESLDDRTAADAGTPPALSGFCNHRAGNTIAHQHYQFLDLDPLPLELAFSAALQGGLPPIALLGHVGVWSIGTGWRAPAYLIAPVPGRAGDRTTTQDALVTAVNLISQAWASIGHEKATQNLFATHRDGQIRAILIPRDRDRTGATYNQLTKRNAGALEMMGYFVIDQRSDLDTIQGLPPARRKALGEAWLTALAPDAAWIGEFEAELHNRPTNVPPP